MNTPADRALLDATDLTLEAVRVKDPALADHIIGVVRRADADRLKAYLDDLPGDIRAKVASIDLTGTRDDILDHLVAELRKLDVDERHVKDILKRTKKLRVGHHSPNKKVGGLPGVARQVAAAEVREVATLAGLTEAAANAVGAAASSTIALDDATLTKLVSSNTLTDAEAKALGFSAALYALTDQKSDLASAIRGTSFPQLGGKAPASVAELAKLAPADWTAHDSPGAWAQNRLTT